MTTYILGVPGTEIVRLLRRETAAAGGQPELFYNVWEDYIVEEEFDRHAFGIRDGREYSLVSIEAVLNIEPRVERDYWVLKVIANHELGPQNRDQVNALVRAELTLDAFATGFLSPDNEVSVRLEAETAKAKEDFGRWLVEKRRRYPAGEDKPHGDMGLGVTAGTAGKKYERMTETTSSTGTWNYRARETVGVFADPEALEAAVDELEVSGFDRAALSVLASDDKVKERLGRLYRAVAEIEDDPRAPQAAFVSKDSRVGGEAAAVGIPFYIGGIAGAFAIVASGGALAATIAAAIAGGAAGAGLGALLARAIARRHADHVLEQLAQGGMILWVSVPNETAEKLAIEILTKAGARDVHVHEIQREWSLRDRPLSRVNIDPLLERDRPASTDRPRRPE